MHMTPGSAHGFADIAWEFADDNPVVVPGQVNGAFDAAHAGGACPFRLNDVYRIYYWGRDADGVNRICIAEAPVDRPNAWRGLGAAVGPQRGTEYNHNGPACPFVFPREDGPWLMYVPTNPKSGTPEGRPTWYTGLAASDDDGITWEYVTSEPLIPCEQPYDCVGTGTVAVLREEGEFRMYYTALAPYEPRPEACVSEQHGTNPVPVVGIGYAVSSDGIEWEMPYEDFLVPPRRGTVKPWENWVARPMVVREDCGYRMWVSATGRRYRVCSLISVDGLDWAWTPADPATGDFGVGPEGAFDGLQRCYAGVVREDDEYRCWYTGNGYGATGMGYAVGRVVDR